MKRPDFTGKSLAKMIPAMIAALIIGGSALTFAMIDETNSVHIDADDIENSTLIVGSHLIYLGAMTDQIYDIAMESAEEANQYNRYYKSELAGGVWYDVTEAGMLADITTDGKAVENKEVEALNMTHHTKSDGVTYDLRTGKAVSVFDIKDPYNLEGLKELEPIKLQYDALVQTEDPSETNERDKKLIKDVYSKDRQTDVTREYDAGLDALQSYYEILVRDGAEAAMSDMVMTVMEKVDHARRAEVLQPLNEGELEKMNRVVSREFQYIEGEVTGEVDVKKMLGEAAAEEAAKAAAAARVGIEDPEEAEAAAKAAEEEVYAAMMDAGREELERFTLNTDLVTAIGEAMVNVQESYINYSSNMLTEGTTVLGQVEYERSKELISLAKAQNYAGCDEVLMKLIYLDRINNSVIREENPEREFVAADLIGRAEDAYRTFLFAGESEAYRTLSSMAAAATRANVLKQQKNTTEIARNEMQFIIQAYIDRMAPETAMEHITERIENIGSFRSGIRADAYESYAQSSVDAYLEWLQQTMKNLQDRLGNRTMDSLMQQKEDLQTERMTALDNNQLGLAKKIEAQIEAIDQEIEDLENNLNAILNSDSTSDSEKARAAAQLGEGSASAALQAMKNNALNDLRDGNLDGINNIIDGIGALAAVQPEGALGALKDVYQELSNQELAGGNTGAIKDLLNKVEEVTAEQMENFMDDFSDADLAKLIDSFMDENGLGGDLADSLGEGVLGGLDLDSIMKNLSDEEMAIVLAGLSMYARETPSDAAEDALLDYSKIAFGDGNTYLFNQLSSDPTFEYVPTDRVAKICKYRYIFNDSQKAVTLQQGSRYYKFKAFSAVAEKGETMEDMSRAAGFQGVIYIPEDMATDSFALEAEYLYKTSFGVLLTEEMKEMAIAFLDYLYEAGGEF